LVLDKEIIYYTDGRLEGTYLCKLVRSLILKSNLPITSVSLKPIDFGRNIYFRESRRHSTLYKQILIGLKASKARFVFFCEHDVLYHKSHFEFKPEREDIYYYNNNWLKFRMSDGKVVSYDSGPLSQLCASRKLLIKHYEKRLAMIKNGERAYGYEPGSGQSRAIDNPGIEYFYSKIPNIDVRHGKNWTGTARFDPKEFKNKKTCQNWKEHKIEEVYHWDSVLLLLAGMKSFLRKQ
jgi:hypothetical protein